MKRLIPLLIICCFVFGCKSGAEKFDSRYEKAESYKAVARVVETSQRYSCSNNETQEDANKCVLEFCKSKQPPENTCLISSEGYVWVYDYNLQAYEKQKKIELMQSYVDLCISYGFDGQNAIAACIQTEINSEKLLAATVNAAALNISALENLEDEIEDVGISWGSIIGIALGAKNARK